MSDGALRLGHPGELVDLPPSSDASPTPAAALARVVGSDADGRVLVTLPAEPERHQNYFRKVEGSQAPFAALWSSGDPRKRSDGTIQMLAGQQSSVLVLPRELTRSPVAPRVLE